MTMVYLITNGLWAQMAQPQLNNLLNKARLTWADYP